MRFRILTTITLTLLVLAPFLIRWGYLAYIALPDEIRIATGPVHGEWNQLSESLCDTIESETGVKVTKPYGATQGSLQHLDLLAKKKVDFALYMRGSRRLLEPEQLNRKPVPLVVANLYSDVCLFLVRRDLRESGKLVVPFDLGKPKEDGTRYRVSLGHKRSGEHSVAEVILDYYFGEDRNFEQETWNYVEAKQGFEDGSLDAAFITAGHQAPIFAALLEEGLCDLGRIPHVDAIVTRNLGMSEATIPGGLFRFPGGFVPSQPLQTLASQTMLLTHEDVPSHMVEKVTEILLSEKFIHGNELFELSQGGETFASDNPEFRIHPAAMAVYDPSLKPLFDPDFMDFLENFRSFGVSLLIAGFLAYQWYHRRKEQRKDHRLDQYFAELLDIDRTKHASVDTPQEAVQLHKALEHLVKLRNDALGEFLAKDFDEDSAADSFLRLCEAVAGGIRAELLRYELRESVRQRNNGSQQS